MSRAKKIAIYCALCILLGVLLFLFKNKVFENNTRGDITETAVLENSTESREEKINIDEPAEDSGEEETEEYENSSEIIDLTEENTRAPEKIKRVYQEKFDLLRSIYNNNEDIIGILRIPGTVIFYPVAYYSGDNNYYLNRNYFKQYSSAGCIFMDYENSVERSDPNIILYGHQMYSTNSMFHSLRYYMDEKYFNEHRYIIFNTVYQDAVWEVFAYFKANVSFNYIKVFFKSEREFLKLAEEMSGKSYFDTGIKIGEGDRILILSSCTNEDPDTRYVLAARLIKNQEDIPADILIEMSGAIDDYIKK